MAQLNTISIYKGEDVSLNFTMTPVTDITGWTIQFNCRNNANDPDPPLLFANATLSNSTGGQFSVVLASSSTKGLGTGIFAYDVQRIDAASVAVLSIGQLIVQQEVRYP